MGKVFDISGMLFTTEDQSHQEFLELLYNLLKSKGIHFSGVTQDITEQYIEKTK